jgi:hypothetical protein
VASGRLASRRIRRPGGWLRDASGVQAAATGLEWRPASRRGWPAAAADVKEEAAGAVEGESVAGGGNEDGSFRPLLEFRSGYTRAGRFSAEVSPAQVRSSI